MSNYHKLYTPQDSAVVFIDHQPQMTFGVANTDRATLINNVTLLAGIEALRNRFAGFFGLGCDCFAF